jgi:hypothetical protein
MRFSARARGLLLAAGLVFVGQSALALIPAPPLSLKNAVEVCDVILVTKVTCLDRKKVVLGVDEDLKGKAPFRELRIDMTKGNRLAEKGGHRELVLKRLARGLPLVLFCNRRVAEKPEAHTVVFAYTNGTWFQLLGRGPRPEAGGWVFVQAEPAARRTFKGTTAELRQVVVDAVAGKRPPPAPDPKEPPGLGPEAGGEVPPPPEA